MTSPPSKCETPVHFFKFIPPGCMSKVSIPIAFRKFLKRIKNTKPAIFRRGNRSWPVKFNDDWVFGDGWKDFVRENGVQELNFVVFKHEGNMVFDIMVYDLTWCEIEYPVHNIDSSKLMKRAKEKDTYKNKSLALREAETIAIRDDNPRPCFTGSLKSMYKLYLPTSFTRPNKLGVGKMIIRNGQTKSKRSWTVELKFWAGNAYALVRGWHDFCTANCLKEGGNFKIELVKNGITPEANFYLLPKETINGKVVQNPFFKSIVTSYGIKDSYLDVPMKFARSNGLVNINCESVIMDEKRKLWPTSICSTSERVRLRGLKDIWAANGLEEGDRFLLELEDNGMKPLFNLHGITTPKHKHPLTHSMINDGNV